MLQRFNKEKALATISSQFVALKLDVSTDDFRKWARKHRHDGNGIPIVYIVRADGTKMFSQSGAPQGDDFPRILLAALAKGGTIFSDRDLQKLTEVAQTAREAQQAGDVTQVVAALKGLRRFGTAGQLGSYAAATLQIDRIANELVEQGKSRIEAAKSEIESGQTSIDTALQIARIVRDFRSYPPLQKEAVGLNRTALRNADLKPLLSDANYLARAEVSKLTSARKKQFRERLSVIKEKYPDSDTATAAEKFLQKLQ